MCVYRIDITTLKMSIIVKPSHENTIGHDAKMSFAKINSIAHFIHKNKYILHEQYDLF